jgi:hypothetical protein
MTAALCMNLTASRMGVRSRLIGCIARWRESFSSRWQERSPLVDRSQGPSLLAVARPILDSKQVGKGWAPRLGGKPVYLQVRRENKGRMPWRREWIPTSHPRAHDGRLAAGAAAARTGAARCGAEFRLDRRGQFEEVLISQGLNEPLVSRTWCRKRGSTLPCALSRRAE